MTNTRKLSHMMLQLAAEMRKHGFVTRHPGGFWCCGSYSIAGSYGTSTVEALVLRGVAEYSEWQEGRNGLFPIRATLVAKAEA